MSKQVGTFFLCGEAIAFTLKITDEDLKSVPNSVFYKISVISSSEECSLNM